MKQGRIIAFLMAAALLLAAPLTRANDESGAIVDREVPTLNDGTRMALEDVERAILDACARGRFRATVVAPGMIKARRLGFGKGREVLIPYSELAYSIRGKDTDQLTGLAGHIESDLDRALAHFKSLQKPTRRAKRINPRFAV